MMLNRACLCTLASMVLLAGTTVAFSNTPFIISSAREQVNKLPASSQRPSATITRPAMQLSSSTTDRRGMLLAGIATLAAAVTPRPAQAEEEIEIYVGAGCFWHVQHEVTEAERKILGRGPLDYTAVVGYAGGKKVGNEGKVCYHNLMMDSDYGRMGHTEVVTVKTPISKVEEFAKLLIPRLFVKGIRADPQDRGGEYRSALGLPGGLSSELAVPFIAAAEAKGMTLMQGVGDEGDTLKDKIILVYDTKTFPFYQGEVYHQYHDDMVEKYGSQYGALRGKGVERGVFKTTGCPEIGF